MVPFRLVVRKVATNYYFFHLFLIHTNKLIAVIVLDVFVNTCTCTSNQTTIDILSVLIDTCTHVRLLVSLAHSYSSARHIY